ncbi:hypothetical protein IQ260_08450 [Leptolyngbya cf. ectocarpi LEGE 11479]|uniref:Uncharacterized protein n=1 Tax=Leptolyngbya cf. ectocarpi LEGE 11479 TaxID=1828722 RepID=A0A928X0H1_LEPEC|nr:hypothetical protein [Leptolyngbya ectocarpi]MBE9066682.1 hypothetical protein [Leptolyngbya cf. ectocarpi LEGE 11479]
MATYPWKIERLAIAFLATFIIADLWQHPRLSSGVIVTTLSKVQETLVNSPN